MANKQDASGVGVTGEQVRDAVVKAGIRIIKQHQCSICNYWVFWFFENGKLFFNPSCKCNRSGGLRRTWQDAADWINLHSNESKKRKIMQRFGFPVEDVPESEE